MAAPYALLEAQAFQQPAQIVKTDRGVGGTAEKAIQRFLSSHNAILHIAFIVRAPSAARLGNLHSAGRARFPRVTQYQPFLLDRKRS
jgi:hypothetical protein